MHVIVTGNQGYIGSVLTPVLSAAGHTVSGIDAGFFRDCTLYPFEDGVGRQLCLDVRDVFAADLRGADAVVHLAAISNDPMGELDPGLTLDINYRASVRLAQLARSAGVRRFLFASSCSVYGQSDRPALDETCALNPQTSYAISKVRAEREISLLSSPRFSPVFMRNATVYGLSPRLRLDLAVNNLAASGFVSGEVRLLSDGMAWRPFVGVNDLAAATLMLLEAPGVHNEAFNIGSNAQNFLIRDLANEIASVIRCSVSMGPSVSADSRTYNVSFDKFSSRFPEFVVRDYIADTVGEFCRRFSASGFRIEDFGSPRLTRLKRLQELISCGEIDAKFRRVAAPMAA